MQRELIRPRPAVEQRHNEAALAKSADVLREVFPPPVERHRAVCISLHGRSCSYSSRLGRKGAIGPERSPHRPTPSAAGATWSRARQTTRRREIRASPRRPPHAHRMAAIGRTSLVGGGRQAHLRQSQQQGLGVALVGSLAGEVVAVPERLRVLRRQPVEPPGGAPALRIVGVRPLRPQEEGGRPPDDRGRHRPCARPGPPRPVHHPDLPPPPRPDDARVSPYVAFNRLRTKLRRSGHLREYFAVVETTQAGALHLHVLATGRYLPQRELSKAAAAAGFGRVADIRAVTGTGDGSARRVPRQDAGGLRDEGDAARLATRGARRLRPVRTSRAWYPGGMAEAEREVGRRMAAELSLAPDPGPWLFVVKGGDGALHVRSQAAPLVLLTTGAGVAQPSGGAATAPGGRGRAASAGRRPARGPGASGARP